MRIDFEMIYNYSSSISHRQIGSLDLPGLASAGSENYERSVSISLLFAEHEGSLQSRCVLGKSFRHVGEIMPDGVRSHLTLGIT